MDAHRIVFLAKNDPYTAPTLEFVWVRIVSDGLVPVVFYDGSVRCLEDFHACMQDGGTLPFVMSSNAGKIIMFCWLNCIEGVTARIHFTFFKDSWGRKRDALGYAKAMLRHVLTRRDSAGYVLDTVVGMTPVSNPLAVRFVQAAGMQKVGFIPHGAVLHYEGSQPVDAVLTVATRDSLGVTEE